MQTLALIGKNAVLNAGLHYILNQVFVGLSVVEFPDGNSFETNHNSVTPDIFVLTIDTTNESEYLRQLLVIRKHFPHAFIVIYDNQLELEKLPAYLRANVQGYISKKSDMSEIKECLTAVQNGKKYLSSDAMNWVINKYSYTKPEPVKRNNGKGSIDLTGNQLIIAKYLAAGMRPTAIAEKLGRKISTISTVKATIFKKLKVTNIVDLKFVTEMHR